MSSYKTSVKVAVGLLALASTLSLAAKELPEGSLISKANIDEVKNDTFEGKTIASMLPEKVEWQIRNYNLSLTLAKSVPVALDPTYLEAAKSNAATVSFDPSTRTVKGWQKGKPFPNVQEGDPHAGDKIIWNLIYGRLYGDSVEIKVSYLLTDGDKGLERIQRYRLDRFFTGGRLSGPASVGDDPLSLQRTLLFAEYPQDIRGIGTFTVRYNDGVKLDDVWAYLKSVRRVRRLSGGAWMDPIGGTDQLNDDLDIWDSPPNKYKSVKLIGKRWILATVHAKKVLDPSKKNEADEFPGQELKVAPYWNPNPKMAWEPREVWVIEGIPPAEHPYSKKIVYVDVQMNRPLMGEFYDKKGDLWKYFNYQQGQLTGEDGYKAIVPVQGQMIDFKRRHASNFVAEYIVNRKGAKLEDFTLGKLEAAGK